MQLCCLVIKIIVMTVVIADDFTGAAEIGGISLRYNLSVDIITGINNDFSFDSDVNIIVTDSRSMSRENAIHINNLISNKIKNLGINNIFKKVDSVFRGYVYDELVEHLKIFNKNRVILIAGNPALKRIIIDGVYYIDKKPLNETCFSKDPEFPIKSSIIKDIVKKTSDVDIFVGVKSSDEIPIHGIVIGDVVNSTDLELWAKRINDDTLPSGSAGFFNYILKSKFADNIINHVIDNEFKNFGENILLVFGSSYSKNNSFINQIEKNGFFISDMPIDLYNQKNIEYNFKYWSENVINAMQKFNKVAITVSHKTNAVLKSQVAHVRRCIAKLVSTVISNCKVDDLLIEGGSTAAAIFKEMKITRIYPIYEYKMGVIKMKVDKYKNLKITTKPGSYKWPDLFLTSMNQI